MLLSKYHQEYAIDIVNTTTDILPNGFNITNHAITL